MERTIRQFGLKVAGAEIALFYYAGHGLQVGGQNYLLPTDARLSSEGDVDFEAVALHFVLKQMEREAKTSLVLLDACRDNPLARNLARAMGTRSGQIAQGLAEVKVGVGTLIGFSTQPGNVSLDGDGLNSPYARALLNHMEAPNRDIGVTLVRVRNDVVKATHGKQVPWEHTSLMGQVVLNAITVPTSSVNYDKEMEIAFWNAVRDSQSAPRLQAYVDQYPTGTFAGLARTMIDELKRADEMRIRAESQRQAVELKAADDVRKAKEQAEQKLALATPLKTDGVPDGRTPNETELIRSIQKELLRVGCYVGKADGQWGPQAVGGLQDFIRRTKVSVEPSVPTKGALAAIEAESSRVCPLTCRANEKPVGEKCIAAAVPKRPVPASQASPSNRTKGPLNASQCYELVMKKYVYIYAKVERESKVIQCIQTDGTNF